MTLLLYLLKINLIFVYFFIKLFTKQKKQVCFLSRQSNEISLNYRMVMDMLDRENIPYKYLVKKINSNINDSLRMHGNYSNGKEFMKTIIYNLKSGLMYYFSLYKQMYLIATSKVIITDGYNLPLCLLKHKKNTKIIQMWHALGAVKKFGFQSLGKKDGISPKIAKTLKMHNNYNYVLSGVASMNDYFAEAFKIDKEKILAIGTPTIDYLLKKDVKTQREIFNKYPILKKKINILYSPTFRNDKKDGFKELIKNFDFKNFNLVITFHPKVKSVIDDQRIIKINRKEFSTYDILKICDYVITDYSALLIDALVLNKKVLFYVFDYDSYSQKNGLNIDVLNEYPNLASKNAHELINIIKRDKYDSDSYKRLCSKYRPTVRNSTKKISNLIKECLDD